MPTTLVTTPTGNIGSRVVARLLDAGTSVRVFVRDPATLAADVRARVESRRGDLADREALAEALRGVDRAFLLIPPNSTAENWRAWQRALGHNMAAAAQQAGVDRAVFLSSLGAHRSDVGPVSGLGEVEGILRDALPNLVVLRPGYFFENAFAALGTLPQTGRVFGAFPPDLAFPQVATSDIGDVAARWLTDTSWSGQHMVGIHGPRDLSMGEQARLLGDALGREVQYVQVPLEAVAGAMAGMGMSASVVDGYREMIGGYAGSRFERPEPRTPETTTPTRFEAWAATVFRPAFEQAGARVAATQEAESRP